MRMTSKFHPTKKNATGAYRSIKSLVIRVEYDALKVLSITVNGVPENGTWANMIIEAHASLKGIKPFHADIKAGDTLLRWFETGGTKN